MEIQEHVNLVPHTTFHIGGPAKFFCLAENTENLSDAVAWARSRDIPILILGGGSNMLVRDSGFTGLVISFAPKGLEVLEETADTVTLKIASGEVWDEVVAHTVAHNWWGVENLSHIPGLMGGFAVQNVGAYGQEASQVARSVEAFDFYDQVTQVFSKADCQFGYRQSVFNTGAKGRYAILATTIALGKLPRPNLKYGDLVKYFSDPPNAQPSQAQIRQAIIEIRDRKFPFPKEAKNGNAGSFFRAHVLTPMQIEHLYQKVGANFGKEALERLHNMADRLMVEQGMKTPTAFLIELCGLKGHQIGGARVHDQHAAIVVNASGQATSQNVLDLFTHVGREVYRQTGVMLHIEPELVGWTPAEKEAILDSVVGDAII